MARTLKNITQRETGSSKTRAKLTISVTKTCQRIKARQNVQRAVLRDESNSALPSSTQSALDMKPD